MNRGAIGVGREDMQTHLLSPDNFLFANYTALFALSVSIFPQRRKSPNGITKNTCRAETKAQTRTTTKTKLGKRWGGEGTTVGRKR